MHGLAALNCCTDWGINGLSWSVHPYPNGLSLPLCLALMPFYGPPVFLVRIIMIP